MQIQLFMNQPLTIPVYSTTIVCKSCHTSFYCPTIHNALDQNQDETTQANCILMTWLAATMIVVSAVLLAAVVSLSITIFFLLAKNKRMATALANAVATYQLEPNTQQPDAEYEVIPEGVHRHIVTEMKTNESYGKLQARDAPPPETGGSGESTYEAVEVGN